MSKFSKVVGSVVGNIECSKELLIESFRDDVIVFVRANNATGIKDAVIATGKTAKGKIILASIQAVMATLKIGYVAPRGVKFDDQPLEDLAFWNQKIEDAVITFTSGIEALGLKAALSAEVKAERRAKADKKKADKIESEIKARGLVEPSTLRPLTNSELINQVLDMARADQMDGATLFEAMSVIQDALLRHSAHVAKDATRQALQDADKIKQAEHENAMLMIEASGFGEVAEKAQRRIKTKKAVTA